jgi:molybdenum cofactor guanylyltransferase
MKTITLTTVLMAGGQSRRMKQDKALVVWEGQTLWEKQWTTLLEIPAQVRAVSAAVVPTWLPRDAVWIGEEKSGGGPVVGLAAVLNQLTTSHALILAIDMPQMTSGFLQGLIACAETGKAVIPLRHGWFEGLAAIYPREASEEVQDCLRTEDHSLQALSRVLAQRDKLWVRNLDTTEEAIFANINEPSQVI